MISVGLDTLLSTQVPPKLFALMEAGAILCGSQAKNLVEVSTRRTDTDWDLFVPPERWLSVAKLLPTDGKLNGFRGVEFVIDNELVDVWVSTLPVFLKRACEYYGGFNSCFCIDYIDQMVYEARTMNPLQIQEWNPSDD